MPLLPGQCNLLPKTCDILIPNRNGAPESPVFVIVFIQTTRPSGSQCRFCLFNNGCKRRFIINSHIGKYLTVQIDSRFFGSRNKGAIGNSLLTTGSINARDPQ